MIGRWFADYRTPWVILAVLVAGVVVGAVYVGYLISGWLVGL